MNSNALNKTSATTTESWIDWTNLVLGAVLLVSPWLGLGGGGSVAANAVVCGFVVACAAGAALAKPSLGAERTNAWVGVWLMVAPWVLAFSGNAGATWTSITIGLAITCFAGIQITRLKRSARG